MSVNLSENEATVLAYRIAYKQMVDSDRWLEWEDYPELGEYAFQRLDVSVRTVVAGYLLDALRLMERTWDIDSAALLEEVS